MSGDQENLWSGEGAAPRADWYPDPGGSGGQRYWDGSQWTDQMRQAPASGPMATGPRPPQMPPPPAAQARYVSPKSPVLAIVLSVLWIGTGHFYAGRTDAIPIVLVCVNAMLILMTIFCFIGILFWIPLVIWVCIDARSAAIDFNNRHGLLTPT